MFKWIKLFNYKCHIKKKIIRNQLIGIKWKLIQNLTLDSYAFKTNWSSHEIALNLIYLRFIFKHLTSVFLHNREEKVDKLAGPMNLSDQHTAKYFIHDEYLDDLFFVENSFASSRLHSFIIKTCT